MSKLGKGLLADFDRALNLLDRSRRNELRARTRSVYCVSAERELKRAARQMDQAEALLAPIRAVLAKEPHNG